MLFEDILPSLRFSLILKLSWRDEGIGRRLILRSLGTYQAPTLIRTLHRVLTLREGSPPQNTTQRMWDRWSGRSLELRSTINRRWRGSSDCLMYFDTSSIERASKTKLWTLRIRRLGWRIRSWKIFLRWWRRGKQRKSSKGMLIRSRRRRTRSWWRSSLWQTISSWRTTWSHSWMMKWHS